MAETTYADPSTYLDTSLPKVWNPPLQRSLFGDLALVLFLLAQCFDGVLTYVGVASYGVGIEANPLIGALMTYLGHGNALLVAKITAGLLGIALHVHNVHGAVALLTLFYVTVAVVPWIAILFL